MKKKLLLILMVVTFVSSTPKIYTQQLTPDGIVEVVAVKGSVFFKGEKISKGDSIEFNVKVRAIDQLIFSTSADWVKVREIKSGKFHQFYKQKKIACANCLFTRGLYLDKTANHDLHDYLSMKPVFIFKSDTIVPVRKDNDDAGNYIAIFQIVMNERVNDRVVGDGDTMIISRDILFGFADDEKIMWPSFQADSIRLIYYHKDTHVQTVPELPYFHVIFAEDALPFFQSMEMTAEEVYDELIENYIDLEYFIIQNNFDNPEAAKDWIKEYIETFFSSSAK